MQKKLIVAGRTLDRLMCAMHEGDVLFEPCRVSSLPLGSCVKSQEEFDQVSLYNLRWLLESQGNRPLELFVSSSSERRADSAVQTYVLPQSLPRGALVHLRDNIYALSPEHYFIWKCRQLPDMIARLLLCDELLGRYSRPTPGETNPTCTYFNEPLTSKHRLMAYLDRAKGVYGVNQARDAAYWSVDNSYSPMETALASANLLPLRHDGWGYTFPQLNPMLSVPEDKRHLTHSDTFMPDVFWRLFRLDLEYDSNERHDSIAERKKDAIRKSDIETLGYRVIPVHPEELYSFEEAERLRLKIGEHMARTSGRLMREHLRRLDNPELAERRRALLQRLLP